MNYLITTQNGWIKTGQDSAAGPMLKEGIDTLLAGDVETGKAILRDYINAAVGFGKLSEATDIPAKSLMRMFGPKGNPRADNLFQIIKHLQMREGIHLEVVPG